MKCLALCTLFIEQIDQYSHDSRFNLIGLLTNSTQRICIVATGGREPATLRSLVRLLTDSATHVHN